MRRFFFVKGRSDIFAFFPGFDHPRVYLAQAAGDLWEIPADGTAHIQNGLFKNLGGEHFPRAVHQIMGFINQKCIITAFFEKKAPQEYSGIKGIIVVANDAVRRQRQLEGKLKRTDAV
jgi:hypothetical protein